jgi:hypothetical protein
MGCLHRSQTAPGAPVAFAVHWTRWPKIRHISFFTRPMASFRFTKLIRCFVSPFQGHYVRSHAAMLSVSVLLTGHWFRADGVRFRHLPYPLAVSVRLKFWSG